MKCLHRLTGHKHSKHPHHHEGHVAGVPHRRPDGTMKLPSHIHFRPTRHHKGFFSKMGHVLRVTVMFGFLPIFMGIGFVVVTSVIGILVGKSVVFLWMHYRRTDGEAAYEALKTDEMEVPPPYEDVQGEAMSEKEVETKA